MGFIYIATPAATDEASEALLAEGESDAADDAAAAAAPAAPAPKAAAATATTTVAAAAPVPASLPVKAPASAADMDLFGGQSGPRIECRRGYTAWQPACLSIRSPFII